LTLPPAGSAGHTDGAAGRDARPLVKTTFSEGNAVFSPDGRWVAYQSNESGRFEVYLRSFEDASQKVQVSTSGGIWPVWAPSGRDLLYRGTGGTVMAAAVVPGSGPRVDAPRVLLDGSRYDNVFAIGPDGTRLLMMPLLVAEQSATQVHLVLDFLEELRQRLK
jgi:serine/threonine-protein kinase